MDLALNNLQRLICHKTQTKGVFNKFPDFFMQAFKIVRDSWKFSILLLYISCDDWLIFMILGSNEQLQHELEYTILKHDCYSMLALPDPRRPDRANPPTNFDDPFFDSTGMIYMHRVPTGQTVKKEYYVEVLRKFRMRFRRKRRPLFKSAQWHFHQDNAPVHNSILVTDYLTKMGIKTVPHTAYCPDLTPCDFCLFPKLRESLEAVVMRQLRWWKRLWRRSLTRSHKRTSMEPCRSCWNGTSALQAKEIISKETRVSCVYCQKSAHKVWKLI